MNGCSCTPNALWRAQSVVRLGGKRETSRPHSCPPLRGACAFHAPRCAKLSGQTEGELQSMPAPSPPRRCTSFRKARRGSLQCRCSRTPPGTCWIACAHSSIAHRGTGWRVLSNLSCARLLLRSCRARPQTLQQSVRCSSSWLRHQDRGQQHHVLGKLIDPVVRWKQTMRRSRTLSKPTCRARCRSSFAAVEPLLLLL